jgi:hypothetical protein
MLIVFASCAHRDAASSTPVKSPSDLIADYVNSHSMYVESFSIVEIGTPDSVYTPYYALQTSSYIANQDIALLYRYQNSISDGNDRKVYSDSIAMLVSEMDSLHHELIAADVQNQLPKNTGKPNNCIAVTAKFRLNGRLDEQTFYYSLDGQYISHTTADNFALIKKTDEYDREFRRVYRDF